MVLPAILLEGNGHEIMLPLKLDVTFGGTRIVDSVCWNLYNSRMTTAEFVLRTCKDLDLPQSFHSRIKMQLDEQLNAYKDIIHLIKLFLVHIPAWQSKVKELQSIPIGVRHNELDYSDNVLWDPMDEQITPESFAREVCEDLRIMKATTGIQTQGEKAIGVADGPTSATTAKESKEAKESAKEPQFSTHSSDMEASIAFYIREALFRRLIYIVETLSIEGVINIAVNNSLLTTDNKSGSNNGSTKPAGSEISAKAAVELPKPSVDPVLSYISGESAPKQKRPAHFRAVPLQVTADMTLSLWKKAKPASTEEIAAAPLPLLPSNRNTNASAWVIKGK